MCSLGDYLEIDAWLEGKNLLMREEGLLGKIK